MIDLRSLDAFTLIARLGSFRAAADKLAVTQPAISTRVAALEQALGVELFERTGRRAVLTPKGREMLAYAERMLELRGAMRVAADEQAAATGRLNIGGSDTLVHTWLPALIKRINERFPRLTLDIQVDLKPAMLTALASRKLDIAFITEPVDDASLTCVPICSYPLGWVAGAALRLPRGQMSLAQVADWPIITHLRHTRTHGSVQDLLARAGRPDARVYTSSSISTTVTMILNGIGIGAIPAAAVAREISERKVRLLDIVDAALPPYDFVAAYPRGDENFVVPIVACLARDVATTHTRRSGRETLGKGSVANKRKQALAPGRT
jgi:DNA-binding transcriptional LysR family regulator